MIKATRLQSEKKSDIKIFIIPGGPGLSSLTLRGLNPLKADFELVYLDFQGTNGSNYHGKKSYEQISKDISSFIKNEDGKKFVLGHSFGGFFAADAFLEDVVSGVICLSTPFLKSTLMFAGNSYADNSTAELVEAEDKWNLKQDEQSFANWLSHYGKLYFNNKDGHELLKNDLVSSKFFLDNRADAISQQLKLMQMKSKSGLKLFVCGNDDLLLSSINLCENAKCGGFDFVDIEGASHFVSVDRPENLNQIIKTKISNYLKGDL